MTIRRGNRDTRPGLRSRVGELWYRSGMLRPLHGMRRWLHRDLRILAYHRVLDIPEIAEFDFDLELVSADADCFREQMQLLRDRFHPVRLGEAVAALAAGEHLPPGAVAVTFDDGYDDNYRVAFPILRELGVPATFFVSTGHIDSGQPFAYDWLIYMLMHAPVDRFVAPEAGLDMRLPPERDERRQVAGEVLRRVKTCDSDVQTALITRIEREWSMPRDISPEDCRPMNWEQLREMHAAGYEIGSHGVHHRILSKLDQDQLVEELEQSRGALQRELGGTAELLAYPVGGPTAFDERVIEEAKRSGYMAACSYISGTNRRASLDRYALLRLPVEREMGTGWFASMLTLPGLIGYPTAGHETRH